MILLCHFYTEQSVYYVLYVNGRRCFYHRKLWIAWKPRAVFIPSTLGRSATVLPKKQPPASNKSPLQCLRKSEKERLTSYPHPLSSSFKVKSGKQCFLSLETRSEAVPREGNSLYSRIGKRAGAVAPGRVLVSARLACMESWFHTPAPPRWEESSCSYMLPWHYRRQSGSLVESQV